MTYQKMYGTYGSSSLIKHVENGHSVGSAASDGEESRSRRSTGHTYARQVELLPHSLAFCGSETLKVHTPHS
jgi:hypothetical protein